MAHITKPTGNTKPPKTLTRPGLLVVSAGDPPEITSRIRIRGWCVQCTSPRSYLRQQTAERQHYTREHLYILDVMERFWPKVSKTDGLQED